MTRLASAPAALLFLLGAALPLRAQEVGYTWVETKFHRVHLHNGNFIDGHVLGVSDRDIHLALPVGEMRIRKNSIERIELIKMRSLLEKPKLDPPLRKASDADGKKETPVKKAAGAFPPAEAGEVLVSNVARILERLKIARASQKDDLVEALARLEHGAPYLASLLPTLDEEPCYMVRSALLRTKDSEAVPYLVRALESDRLYVQINALTLLSVMGTADNGADVRRFLSDPNPAVVASAIDTLQQLGDQGSLDPILDLIRNGDDMIRVAAIAASLELGRRFDRMEAVADGLRRALPSSQGRVARELLGAAARSGRRELWDPVSVFLRDPDSNLRRSAAEALGALAAPESAEIVLVRLHAEQDPRTMVELIKVLVNLKSTEAVIPIIDLLRSRDANIVRAAAAALESLTKERFGDDHDKWSAWWERNHPK